MRAVVVGANGFLGSHLVDQLVRAGHEVAAIDRFRQGRHQFEEKPSAIIATSLEDTAVIEKAFRGAEAVIDLLGASNPLMSVADPDFDRRETLPRQRLLTSVAEATGVGHYYFSSTGGAIYGDSPKERNHEEDVPHPLTAYGLAKLEMERHLDDLRRRGSLASTVWRFANPYGPRQDPLKKQGLIAVALHHHLRGTPLPVMGGGVMVRDYLYVDDAISRAAAFLGRHTAHHTYNIGSGVGRSVTEVLAVISEVVGEPLETVDVPLPPGFVARSVVDTTRFDEEFGHREDTPFVEGVRKTWEYLRHAEEKA